MKIRSGFVSNSSSSSFLIYGISIEDEEALVNGFNRLVEEGVLEGPPVNNIYGIPDFLGLSLWITPWDTVYLGLSWDSVGDQETGGAFKKRAESLIRKVLPNHGQSLHTLQEAWRDG